MRLRRRLLMFWILCSRSWMNDSSKIASEDGLISKIQSSSWPQISELMSLAKRRLRSDLIPERPLILRINSLMISRLESWKILKTISHLNSQIELIIKLSLDHWIRKISSLFSIKRSKPSLLHGRLMKKWNYLNLARLKLRKLLIRFMILSLVRDLLRDISMMKLSHKLSIHFWNNRSNIENSLLREFFWLLWERYIACHREAKPWRSR